MAVVPQAEEKPYQEVVINDAEPKLRQMLTRRTLADELLRKYGAVSILRCVRVCPRKLVLGAGQRSRSQARPPPETLTQYRVTTIVMGGGVGDTPSSWLPKRVRVARMAASFALSE